ncbi:MAG: hypothetical protein OEY85_00415 [Rhodospirillales bacterium]|nr:hypothetical protein [Rhodospirillales bacterium]
MARLLMIIALFALFSGFQPLRAEGAPWMVMARHGECMSLESAARRLPELRGVSDPYSFALALRQAGEKVSVSEQTVKNITFVKINAPDRGLAMVFVPPVACR